MEVRQEGCRIDAEPSPADAGDTSHISAADEWEILTDKAVANHEKYFGSTEEYAPE